VVPMLLQYDRSPSFRMVYDPPHGSRSLSPPCRHTSGEKSLSILGTRCRSSGIVGPVPNTRLRYDWNSVNRWGDRAVGHSASGAQTHRRNELECCCLSYPMKWRCPRAGQIAATTRCHLISRRIVVLGETTGPGEISCAVIPGDPGHYRVRGGLVVQGGCDDKVLCPRKARNRTQKHAAPHAYC
jgi:hypothetical protein